MFRGGMLRAIGLYRKRDHGSVRCHTYREKTTSKNYPDRQHQEGELIISIDQLVLIVGQFSAPSIDG